MSVPIQHRLAPGLPLQVCRTDLLYKPLHSASHMREPARVAAWARAGLLELEARLRGVTRLWAVLALVACPTAVEAAQRLDRAVLRAVADRAAGEARGRGLAARGGVGRLAEARLLRARALLRLARVHSLANLNQ